MPDYKNGLIYTIRSTHTEKIYIGSTCQPLYKRFFDHRCKYTQYKKGAPKYTSSYKILEFGDSYIELLESYPCNNKMELHKREGELIRQYKDVCVNMCVAGRTYKQYKMENKEKIKEKSKEYSEKNKEQIKEKGKQYYQENKEQIKEKGKQYYQENKEQINEREKKRYYNNLEKEHKRCKKYREKNKERLIEKHNCDCGGHYTLTHKARHEKSIKHLNFIKQ